MYDRLTLTQTDVSSSFVVGGGDVRQSTSSLKPQGSFCITSENYLVLLVSFLRFPSVVYACVCIYVCVYMFYVYRYEHSMEVRNKFRILLSPLFETGSFVIY